MNPIEEMMSQMGGRGGIDDMKFITGEEREQARKNFIHIEDLKEGDVLQFKRGMKDCKFPAYDQTVEVFRVFPVGTYSLPDHGSNHSCDENNFSILVRSGDNIFESAFDSRRFEKVESKQD